MNRHVVTNDSGDAYVVSYDGELVITQNFANLLDALDSRGENYRIESQ